MSISTAALGFCVLLTGHAHADVLPEVYFDQTAPIQTSEGHATLSWDSPGEGAAGVEFQLQESQRSDFQDVRIRYRGPDRASFISGLPDGATWFRVRAVAGEAAGPWSAPIAIHVTYPSRAELVPLLSLGALVFAVTVATVIAGHRRHGVVAR